MVDIIVCICQTQNVEGKKNSEFMTLCIIRHIFLPTKHLSLPAKKSTQTIETNVDLKVKGKKAFFITRKRKKNAIQSNPWEANLEGKKQEFEKRTKIII